MKLHRVENGDWFGTQAEAKAAAKQLGRQFEQVDVPTDKPGLLEWLNSNTIIFGKAGCDDVEEVQEEIDELHEAEQRAIEQARARDIVDRYRTGPGKDVSRAWDASDIEDFILNRADVAIVERVFAVLGTRFKELVKQLRGEQ